MMGSNCKLMLGSVALVFIGLRLAEVESYVTEGGRLSPVVFIPGTGGNRLEARLDRPESGSDSCPKQSEWYRLWLNVWTFLFGRLDCWTEVIRLHYNVTTGSSENAPGVSIRVPGWGDTEGVEYLDPSFTAWAAGNVGEYAAPLVKEFVRMGYVRGHNLRAAPYDFRFAPHSSTAYLRALKTLIEETYRSIRRLNGNTKVTVFAHSLGGLFGLYFLNQQPQTWKDHYIHSFASLNTPWRGVTETLQLFASGFTFGSSLLDPWTFRTEQRSQETNVYMLPAEGTTEYDWNSQEVLLTTPNRSYTVADLGQFFRDIGYPLGHSIHQRFLQDDYVLRDPGTSFYCIHSSGVNVAGQMIYEKGWDKERRPTRIVSEDGDGTVNIRSLKGCRKVQEGRQTNAFHMHDIAGTTHNGVFKDARLYNLLKEIVGL